MPHPFDPSAVRARLAKLWSLSGHFGFERGANPIYLDEIVSDRLQFLTGLQVLRDELYFAATPATTDREACTADLSQPSVVTTLAFTNCGDRIHQGEVAHYEQVVASRFATLSELGVLKAEAFHPTGGGTDNGATLAHVTWAHVLDESLRRRVYSGNPKSFVLCAFDLKTHVGRLDEANESVVFGRSGESPWRQPRAACGAIVGALEHFNEGNDVHRRIRSDLGDANFDYLSKTGVKTTDGVDITAAVAAAIVALRGMQDTAEALANEMDERGVAHLTASVTVNRPAMHDTLLYLARATVFGGELRVQGFGMDAQKYSGSMVPHGVDRRLRLSYDGHEGADFEVVQTSYTIRKSAGATDLYV